MGSLRIRVANFFAKYSCPAWQRSRVIRKIFRRIYRTIMEKGAKNYPYESYEFANWPESDEEGKYSLVTDSDGFVIRRSPSYVAWQMRKVSGKRLKRPVPGERKPGEHAFDAKHWGEILEFNGWQKMKKGRGPIMSDAINGAYLVGVMPDEGEFGQVIWFEGVDIRYVPGVGVECVENWNASSYKDFRKMTYVIPATEKSNVVWYREPDTVPEKP